MGEVWSKIKELISNAGGTYKKEVTPSGEVEEATGIAAIIVVIGKLIKEPLCKILDIIREVLGSILSLPHRVIDQVLPHAEQQYKQA